MHVLHHLRPLPLLLNAPANVHAARKKRDEDDDPDKVPPVKARADEDDAREQRRRQQAWTQAKQRCAELPTNTAGPAFEAAPAPQPAPLPVAEPPAAPTAQSALPLDQLLAGIMGGTPPTPERAAEPSLDDLLALMRTPQR